MTEENRKAIEDIIDYSDIEIDEKVRKWVTTSSLCVIQMVNNTVFLLFL